MSGVGAKHVSSAHLQLEVANVTNAGSVSGGSIHAITNCTWDELTMTWNTAPPIDGPALVTLGAVAAGQGVDFDVTAAIPGDGVYCFAIDTTSTDSAIYNSREGSGVPPALVVQVAP
ncbi:MAG: DNRLRE domain-containing protein [Deltaproteobacteria bacterium]|nr:MAG: DNRLRE domain-containing protein [Deltaproteobacteria bacterium]